VFSRSYFRKSFLSRVAIVDTALIIGPIVFDKHPGIAMGLAMLDVTHSVMVGEKLNCQILYMGNCLRDTDG
jgi:hypothetical protein